MLTEKCNEFGDVQRVEDKGNGSVLVIYSSDWEAENAFSILLSFYIALCFLSFLSYNFSLTVFSENLDRARIDGRTINVCFF